VKLKDSKQFDLALTKLANELVHANVFYKLFMDINGSFKEFRAEVRESNTFWALVHESLRESASIRLCRVYDKCSKTNSLPNVLKAIKANPYFFELESYADRIKDNEHIDPIERHKMPDNAQLQLDIEFASESNPAVKKLVKWRNNLFAHRSSALVIKDMGLPKEDLPTFGDLSALLDMTIINRYTGLFRSTSYSTQMIGHDDYKHVFKSIRNEAIRRKELLRLEYEKYRIPFPSDESA
jgi:AbiU2